MNFISFINSSRHPASGTYKVREPAKIYINIIQSLKGNRTTRHKNSRVGMGATIRKLTCVPLSLHGMGANAKLLVSDWLRVP